MFYKGIILDRQLFETGGRRFRKSASTASIERRRFRPVDIFAYYLYSKLFASKRY
jgi:hypothetical protein